MTFPHKRKVPAPTAKQADYRMRFRFASRHATNCLKDPETLEAYRALVRPGQTAYNLALSDILKTGSIRKFNSPEKAVSWGQTIIFPAGIDRTAALPCLHAEHRTAAHAGFRVPGLPGLLVRLFRREAIGDRVVRFGSSGISMAK